MWFAIGACGAEYFLQELSPFFQSFVIDRHPLMSSLKLLMAMVCGKKEREPRDVSLEIKSANVRPLFSENWDLTRLF